MNKLKKSGWLRGQTTIEFFLIIAVALVALTIVYSIYVSQTSNSFIIKDATLAKSTVNKFVFAANSVYSSGVGSRVQVLLNVPDNVDFSQSYISGRTVSLHLDNNTDIVAVADVNIVGSWKSFSGAFYAYLSYDGNVVNVSYELFELNKEGIAVSALPSSLSQQSITIRNNSSDSLEFWVSSSFNHPYKATLSMSPSASYFTLASGSSTTIDFNFSLTSTAIGNYSGLIQIIGGTPDANETKNVFVSVEALPRINYLIIYPQNTSFSSVTGNTYVKNFSICNVTSSNISSITWSKDGNANGWFSNPSITSVAANDCNSFSLSITVPPGTSSGYYQANLDANYPAYDSNYYIVSIRITNSSS